MQSLFSILDIVVIRQDSCEVFSIDNRMLSSEARCGLCKISQHFEF